MKVHRTLDTWRASRAGWLDEEVGFVPTMGALHAGHESLVLRSLAENRFTVVSIFLNPTQFDAAADLESYPVDLDADLALLESLGVDAVLMPDYDLLYPDDYRYRVIEAQLAGRFCGAHRPGHFDGVLSVVLKLFNLVRPARAYFGEKDYQQLELVRGMVEAFFLPVQIVACPTVREPDGLALSSRNQRLDEAGRRLAPRLHQSLLAARDAPAARVQLEREGFAVDYVEDYAGRRLAAVILGDVRLIDNVPLEGERP